MPKVSVIIPTYNRCEILARAVRSVLTQTLQNFEVIIIDDGSEDRTKETVESLSDGRIRYFFKANGGAASARNLGLSKATGDYIAFLDSDDFWPKTYLEIMLKALEENEEYGAAYSRITVVLSDGREVKSDKKPEGKSGWITLDLFKHGFIWLSASIFRSSLWEGFYFDEALKTSEGSDAFLRLSINTIFKYVDEVEAFHSMIPDSLCKEVDASCANFLVLERFFYKLGGHEYIPYKVARRKLSHASRKVAEEHRLKGERRAALAFYRRAIRHWPGDLRLYPTFLRSLFSRGGKGQGDQFIIPGVLGDPVGPHRFTENP